MKNLHFESLKDLKFETLTEGLDKIKGGIATMGGGGNSAGGATSFKGETAKPGYTDQIQSDGSVQYTADGSGNANDGFK